MFKPLYTRDNLEINVTLLHKKGLSQDFFTNLSLPQKKRSSHQGKKEQACIVSKPYVSHLFVGMWRVCKSSKIKHPGGSGGLCPPDSYLV